MSENEEFYKNLDMRQQSRSSCSCLSFAILILLILTVAELLLFYIAGGLKHNTREQVTSPTTDAADRSFAFLEEDKAVRIIITEGVLCSDIADARGQSQLGCDISDTGVSFSGKIATFLPSNASITVLPVVEGGEILYNIQSVKIGKFKIFKPLAPTISGVFKNTLDQQLKDIKVKKIELDEGIMTIVGEKEDSAI